MTRTPRRGIILELIPREAVDFSEVVVDHANGRPVDLTKYEVINCPSPIDYFRPEFLDYLVTHGISSYLRREVINEEIVTPQHARDVVADLIRGFLRCIEVGEELVIIDPYFFARTPDAQYDEYVHNILAPFLPQLKRLRLITTARKIDGALLSKITENLKAANPELEIKHLISEEFHDRFWINGAKTKGFVMGTSLNGIGKRYALLDQLREQDVTIIMSALSTLRLLD